MRDCARALTKCESVASANSLQTVTMHTTLVLLSLFGLAHSAQIYSHPPIAAFGSLPDSYVSALVAQHLHLDRFEPLQDIYAGALDQSSFVGKGACSSLLVGIDDGDAECQLAWRVVQVVI